MIDQQFEKEFSDGRAVIESLILPGKPAEIRMKIINTNNTVSIELIRGTKSEEIAQVLKRYKEISPKDKFEDLIRRFDKQ